MTFRQNTTNNKHADSGTLKVLSYMRKLLLRGILATLGVGGLVTGLQSTVLAANLNVLSQSEAGISTLSGESLRGIENRNNLKDYSTISSEPTSIIERKPILLSHNTERPVVQIPSEILDLIERIEVDTGGSSLDCDQLVKVQYHMDSM
jgi:hypothetical protein